MHASNEKQMIATVQMALNDRILAVRDRLARTPIIPGKGPVNMADAFIRLDPVLASLDKQRHDLRAHYMAAAREGGFEDMMAQMLFEDLEHVEAAFADRLASLRRRHEESDRAAALVRAYDQETLTQRKAQEKENEEKLKAEQDRLQDLQRRLNKRLEEDRSSPFAWFLMGIALGLWNNRTGYYANWSMAPTAPVHRL